MIWCGPAKYALSEIVAEGSAEILAGGGRGVDEVVVVDGVEDPEVGAVGRWCGGGRRCCDEEEEEDGRRDEG